ncbi:MAG: hypothetical protein WCB99_08875, partial [Candidatus Cybelea sp.]
RRADEPRPLQRFAVTVTRLFEDGKPLRKVDTDGKQLIIDLLEGEPSRGFDIDSFFHTTNGWVILEALKTIAVRPWESDPNRFWDCKSNPRATCWRKYTRHWQVKLALNATYYIVNYELPYDQFKIMLVQDVLAGPLGGMRFLPYTCHIDAARRWLKKINDSVTPVEDVRF